MPSQEFVAYIFLLIFVVLLFSFLYSFARDSFRTFGARRWLKFFLHANKARLANQHAEARRLLHKAWLLSRRLPHQWQIRGITLGDFAELLRSQGKYRQADRLRRRLLALYVQFGGARSPEAALAASGLATILDDTGKHAEAEPLHRHSV